MKLPEMLIVYLAAMYLVLEFVVPLPDTAYPVSKI